MDKILIKDLQVQGVIGIHPHERIAKQRLIVNLILLCDISACGRSDYIGDTVDYSKVVQKVLDYGETSQLLTLEAFATGVAKICLYDFDAIKEVTVKVDKPAAIYLAAASALEI